MVMRKVSLYALLMLAAGSLRADSRHPTRATAKIDIEARIQRMTPEQRVGQLMLVSFDSPNPDANLREMVRSWGVGGVVLYRTNLRSATQARELTAQIRTMATGRLAPFIAIDQEGGNVIRLRDGVPELPGNMALGATRSRDLAFQAGAQSGAALRRLGFTMNFAPVLDVYVNPASAIGTRSFSDEPGLVSRLGTAFIEGQSSVGLISVAKHFVGEAEAPGDSHDSHLEASRTREEIEARDLPPFIDAFAHGLPAVMTSHVVVPRLTCEGGVPVTFSYEVLTTILRDQLRFEGVVISDALTNMKSVSTWGTIGEVAVRALIAGADMVLVPGTPAERRAVFDALLEAQRSGRLSDARIRASLRRIIRLKAGEHGGQPGTEQTPPSDIATAIADQSITLVEGSIESLLSIASDRSLQSAVYVGPAGSLSDLVESRRVALPHDMDEEAIRAAVDAALGVIADRDVVIAAAENRGQAEVLRRVASARPQSRFVLISLGNPHDLEWAQSIGVRIAAYSSSPASQRAVARVLRGELTPRGQLPVVLRDGRLDPHPSTSLKSRERGETSEESGMKLQRFAKVRR